MISAAIRRRAARPAPLDAALERSCGICMEEAGDDLLCTDCCGQPICLTCSAVHRGLDYDQKPICPFCRHPDYQASAWRAGEGMLDGVWDVHIKAGRDKKTMGEK